MPKEVVANGKTFTFDDNVSVDDISEAIDDYFSNKATPTSSVESEPIQKKSSIQSTDGGEDSKVPVQPTTELGSNTKSKFSDFDPYAGTEINADNTSVTRVEVTKDVASKSEGVKAKAKEKAKSLDVLKAAASPDYLFKNTVNSLAKGLVKSVAGLPKSIAITANQLDPFEDRKLEDMPTYKAGKWMEETADDLFPTDQNLKKDFMTGKLPETMGNAAGYMAAGATGGTLSVALLGGTQNMSDEYHAALAETGDEDLAFKTSLRAFAIGTLEAAPVASFFNKLDKATGGMVNKQLKSGAFGELAKKFQSIENTKVGGAALGGIEEMAQESTSQILNNLNAQQSYNATVELTDGLEESVLMGLGFGLVMNGFRKSLETKRDNAATPEEKAQLDKAIELTQPKEEVKEKDVSVKFNPDKAAEIINQSVEEHITQTATEDGIQSIDPGASGQALLPGANESATSQVELPLPDNSESNNSEMPSTGSEITEGADGIVKKNQNQEEVIAEPAEITNFNETQNLEPIENEIQQPVPQGEHGKSDQGDSRNEEVASELRKRIGATQTNAQESGRGGEISEVDRESENRAAFDYAKETNTWVENIYTLGDPFQGGNENTNVFNSAEQKVYKSNNLMNTQSLDKYLEKIKIHNTLFPQTKYSFVGFSGIENKGIGKPSVEPVYSQDFIKDGEFATTEEIDNYFTGIGFKKLAPHRFERDGIEVYDARPRNVLKDKEGNIFVVDAEFKVDPSKQNQVPPPKQELPKEPTAEKPKKVKSVYQNAIKRAELPEATKQILQDNIYYDTFSNKEANSIADGLIAESGSVEEALKLTNEDAQLPPSVKVKMYIKGITQLSSDYKKATDDADKRDILERQADLMDQLDTFARDGGRKIEAVKELYSVLPEAIVIKKKRELKKLNDTISEVNVSNGDLDAINVQLATEVAKSAELQKEIALLQKQLNSTKKTEKREAAKKLVSEGLDELASIIGARKNFVPDYESQDLRRAIKKIFKGLAIELEITGDDLVAKVKELLLSKGLPPDGLDDALEENRPDKINVGAIVKSALAKLGEKSLGKDSKKQHALHQAVLAEINELDIPEDRKKVLADKIVKGLKEKSKKVVETHLNKKYTKSTDTISIEKSSRKIAEDINNGVLNKEELQSGFAAALGTIDLNDPVINDRLNVLSNNIANANTDITRFKAELAMSEYMATLQKSPVFSKLVAYSYANMLLSIGSPLTNIAFGLQVVAKEFIYNTAALLKSGLTGRSAEYQKSLAIYSAMASAATGKGSVLARDILRTGNALENAETSPIADALINNQKELKTTLDKALDMYAKGMSMAFRNLRAGDAFLSTMVQNKAEFEEVYDTALAAENLKASESLLYQKKSYKQIANETLKLFNGKIRENTEFGQEAAKEIETSQNLTEPLLVEKGGKMEYNPIYKDKKYNDIKRLHALATFELQEKARGIEEDKKEEIVQTRMEQMLMSEPQGDAGVMYKSLTAGFKNSPIGKLTLVPFLKVALNATNQMIERSPLGTAVYLPKYILSATAQKKLNPQMSTGTFWSNTSVKNAGLDPYLNDKAKSRMLRRQLLGMATTAAIYGLTQIEFDEEDENGKKTGSKIPLVRVNGRGYHNWSENNNLRYADPSFEEYSMVLYNPATKNKSTVKYKTSILAGPLIVLGILDDYKRYGKQTDEETASVALKAFMITSAYAEFVGESSSMKGMADVVKGLQDLGNDIKEGSKIGKWEETAYTFLAKKIPSLTPIPLRAMKELDQMTAVMLNSEAKQATLWYEHAMRDVPMLNSMLHYKFDHLGDPVEKVFDVPMLFNDQYKKKEIYAINEKYGYQFKFMKDRVINKPGGDVSISPVELRDLNLQAAKLLKQSLYKRNESGETGIQHIVKSAEKGKTDADKRLKYKTLMDAWVITTRKVAKLKYIQD